MQLRHSPALAAMAMVMIFAMACGTTAPSPAAESAQGLAATASPALPSAATASAGQSLAPDFALPTAAGGEIKLSQFRGNRDVVLVFYRAYW